MQDNKQVSTRDISSGAVRQDLVPYDWGRRRRGAAKPLPKLISLYRQPEEFRVKFMHRHEVDVIV